MPKRQPVKYYEYIRSPAWAKKKAQYRASKLPQTCVVCGVWKVDLHHRTYARLGREKLTDLTPLCREHHTQAHAIRSEIDAKRAARGKRGVGGAHGNTLATAKQLAYIRRLGGTPLPEMTGRQARRMAERLMKSRRAA